MIFTYHCENYVLMTNAASEDFYRIVKEVKEALDDWDVYDVAMYLMAEDFTADVSIIAGVF